jgi:uroporphyrinogen decarboxylase
MLYREIVIESLNHKQTKHTPWAFETTGGFGKKYREQFSCENVEEDLESHIMFGRYNKVRWLNSKVYEDIFGVQWRLGEDGGDIGVPINQCIDWNAIDDYVFPDIIEDEMEKCLASMRQDTIRFRMFRMSRALFERAWSMAGMDNIFMNMMEDEKKVMRLFERITGYQLRILDRILDEDFDGVFISDDYGYQSGLMMGAKLWRQFIKPFVRQICEKIKSKGKFVLFHSCGDNHEIFPGMIEIGIDAYNTVQPEIYDLAKIKKEYGKDLTFWGAVSLQNFLPFHTPKEVFEKSVETIHILGGGGGYIFSPTHAITADIPPQNIRAMRDAAKTVYW